MMFKALFDKWVQVLLIMPILKKKYFFIWIFY